MGAVTEALTGATEAFRLSATLSLNTSGYESGLAQAEGQLSGFGTGVAKAAKTASKVVLGAATTTAVAAGKFVKEAISTGMDFDAMMSDVQAISGAQGDDFDLLRQKAMELGATTKFTATEAAGAFHYMAMAGWKTEDMLSGVDAVLALAAASGEDLGTTSDIVTDALTAFGLKAEDAIHFANVLATTAANANTNVYMMGETFKYVAPIAGALGISAEDTALSIGLMANQGIKASQAGTALRNIYTRLAVNTGSSNKNMGARDVLDALGVQFFEHDSAALQEYESYLKEVSEFMDDDGNIINKTAEEAAAMQEKLNTLLDAASVASGVRDWSDILTDLREAWAGLEDTEQMTYYAKQVAGSYGLSGFLALMNSTQEDWDKLAQSIDSADEGEGAAQQMALTMLDNLKGDITILNSALDGLKLVVSDEYKEQIRGFIQMLTEEVGKLTEAFKDGGPLGMVRQLLHDLFGVGSELDTITEKTDAAVTDADVNYATAGGILNYMETLVGKYGEAASKTAEWKAATEELEKVMPGVGDKLTAQGSTLDQNIAKVRAMSEEMRKAAIMNAMQEGLNEQFTLYGQQRAELEKTALRRDIAQGEAEGTRMQLNGIVDALMGELDMVAGIPKNAGNEWRRAYNTFSEGLANGGDIAGIIEGIMGSLKTFYKSGWNEDAEGNEIRPIWERGELGDYNTEESINGVIEKIEGYETQVEEANAKIEDLNKQIADTEKEIEVSQAALETASAKFTAAADGVDAAGTAAAGAVESAGENLAGAIDTVTASALKAAAGEGEDAAPHAKGAWSIPYDDYPARLHRGEMVLTASQARRYREGSGTLDMSGIVDAIRAAVVEGMAQTPVRAYIDGEDVTDRVNRNQAEDYTARRYAT